jgi:hypothetical protein
MAWRARVIEFVGGDHANRIPLDVRRSVPMWHCRAATAFESSPMLAI